jgi:hypothetical protein
VVSLGINAFSEFATQTWLPPHCAVTIRNS